MDTELSNVIGDVWKSTFAVPAGDWEYKVALNDTWDVSYPSANVALSVGAATDVSIYHSHLTHWVADSETTGSSPHRAASSPSSDVPS